MIEEKFRVAHLNAAFERMIFKPGNNPGNLVEFTCANEQVNLIQCFD
jgi:hypothetical protein